MKKFVKIILIILSLISFGLTFVYALQTQNKDSLVQMSLKVKSSEVIEIPVETLQGTSFMMGLWNDRLITAMPVWSIKINSSYGVVSNSKVLQGVTRKPFIISQNLKKSSFLFIGSEYNSLSIGSLYEMDLQDYSVRKIIDSTENVSSAVYVGSSNDEIVYYSLGNPEGVNAGYYKYNMETKAKELVFSYYSELGKEETINGFDISPDGKTMLVPIVKVEEAPKILRYDLEKREIIDTLDIKLPGRYNQLLWLRYNNDGTKILYSNYSQRSFSIGPGYPCELGIYELSNGSKKIISIKPEDETWDRWTAPCPNWSPDCKHIVYGMAMIANKSWAVSAYRLYVKTNVDLETTGVTETPAWKLAKMFLW